jgi:hypothetical protein
MLFDVFDTQHKGMVDALEIIATLTATSAMSCHDISVFIFDCYDLEGSGSLVMSEISLAVEFTLVGLCKIYNIDLPTSDKIKQVMDGAFVIKLHPLAPGRHKYQPAIERKDFEANHVSHPELVQWLQIKRISEDDTNMTKRQSSAATKLQCVQRRHLAKEAVGTRREQSNAATKLQSIQRQRTAQGAIVQRRQEEVAFFAALEEQAEEEEQVDAAVAIQAVHRKRLAKEAVGTRREQSHAATKLQCVQRQRSAEKAVGTKRKQLSAISAAADIP